MRNFFVKRGKSFRFAFSGCRYVIQTQQNAWIHAFISIAVILLGLWLQINWRDWAVILLSMALVWVAEFVNTALETLVDLTSPGQHNLARISKDVGAAAVLIAAFCSVLVGLLILGPPLWSKLQILLNF